MGKISGAYTKEQPCVKVQFSVFYWKLVLVDFDFEKLYQDYNNVQLLEIIEHPEQYQPKAVEAAKNIIAIRNPDEQEMMVARQHFSAAPEIGFWTLRFHWIRRQFQTYFLPIVTPEEEFQPTNWFKAVIGIYIILVLFRTFSFFKLLWYYLRCSSCQWDLGMSISMVELATLLTTLLLLRKRHPWAWKLLFGYNLIVIVTGAFNLFYTVQVSGIPSSYYVGTLVVMTIRLYFAWFLWQYEVAGFFGILSNDHKKDTLVVATIMAVAILFVVKYLG